MNINAGRYPLDRVGKAKRLKSEMDKILSCGYFDEWNVDCKHFRTIAHSRKKTAQVLVTVGNLKSLFPRES